MSRPAVGVTVAVTALALLAAACGGGDGVADGGGTDRTAPARVIEVKALGTLRFDPATIQAQAGERVELRVVNADSQPHELAIGDAAYHQAHEAAGSATPGHDDHEHGDAPGAAVRVEAGETKTLAYTMPATPPTYACHIASHDDAGMTGTVTY